MTSQFAWKGGWGWYWGYITLTACREITAELIWRGGG